MSILLGSIPRKYPWFDLLMNILLGSIAVWLILSLLFHLQWSPFWPAEFLLGLAGADLITGLVHYTVDRLELSEGHHQYPHTTVTEPFYSQTGESILTGSALFLLSQAYLTDIWMFDLNLLNILIWTFGLGAFTEEYHRCQHLGFRAPWVIQFLWTTGIFVTHHQHKIHHDTAFHGPYLQNYCILTGWSEPLITSLDLLLGPKI